MSFSRGSMAVPLHTAEAESPNTGGMPVDDSFNAGLNNADAANECVEYSAWEKRMRWDIYSKPEYVVESSWVTPLRFLQFKGVVFAWSLAIYIMTLTNSVPVGKFYVFLTNWNQSALLIYFACSFYLCARHYHGRRALPAYDVIGSASSTRAGASSYHPNAYFLRFVYFMNEHAFAWTVLVVGLYWSTEFPHWYTSADRDSYALFSTSCIHALTLLWIVSDLMLGRVEMVLSHLFYTIPISFVYLTVNAVYCKIAGGFIYQILKWNNFVTAVAILGACAFIVVNYLVGHWLCKQRNKLSGNQAPPLPGQWCSCR